MNNSMKFTGDHGDKEDYSKYLSLKDAAQSSMKNLPIPPLPTGNPNGLLEKNNRRQQFIIALGAMEHKKKMVYEAKRWIGVLVYKEIKDRLGYLGKVQSYDEDTELYKIVYDQEGYEELTKEEMMEIIAPPHLACEYLTLKETEEKEEVEKSKAPKAKTSVKKKRRSSVRQSGKKEKAKTAKVGDYVPLAFREKKRDEYYWY